ncbi:Uncharacterized protein Adt_23881 [Abeliophyllum distichum]|uniref:Uncharacterized protein n=1 Tax=Abeliophyllum distichum TaxID=126358 RepID=A0ABD1SCX7_9LAMI
MNLKWPIEVKNHKFTPTADTEVNEDIEVTYPVKNAIREPPLLRKSYRVITKSARYLLVGEPSQAISTEQDDNSTSFKEAMKNTDTNLWKIAKNSKIELMYFNEVWELVNALEGLNT